MEKRLWFRRMYTNQPQTLKKYQRVALGSSEEKTEHEAQQISLVGAHFRIRIHQGHPIRPILDRTRCITDQIGRNAMTRRLLLQPRELDFRFRDAARMKCGDADSGLKKEILLRISI